jgi:hypothetical protein
MNDDEAPNLDSVVPWSENDPPGQNQAFRDARQRAHQFLQSFKAASIEREYLGGCIDRIVYIFLFKVRPLRKDVDPWVWVVVGDIPSACFRCVDCKTPYEALGVYIEEMNAWVAAAREGRSVAGLIPVNVPATPANAEMLSGRLQFLETEIKPLLEGAP